MGRHRWSNRSRWVFLSFLFASCTCLVGIYFYLNNKDIRITWRQWATRPQEEKNQLILSGFLFFRHFIHPIFRAETGQLANAILSRRKSWEKWSLEYFVLVTMTTATSTCLSTTLDGRAETCQEFGFQTTWTLYNRHRKINGQRKKKESVVFRWKHTKQLYGFSSTRRWGNQ